LYNALDQFFLDTMAELVEAIVAIVFRFRFMIDAKEK
jgi:hypothetical protein